MWSGRGLILINTIHGLSWYTDGFKGDDMTIKMFKLESKSRKKVTVLYKIHGNCEYVQILAEYYIAFT